MSDETPQEAIFKATGISKTEQDEIVVRIKANRAKLDNCQRPHDFSICLDRRTKEPIKDPAPHQLFGARWQCSKCGGEVEGQFATWYNLGLRDGKK